MTKSGNRQFSDDRRIDAADQNSDGEESADVSSSSIESPATGNPSISRRLTDIIMEDVDEDLLLRRSDVGYGFLQWLQAFDMQVMGACRADERLKPLLKLNISSGEAEDRLLAQLCEHFEPSEVGLLARCLCAPLVSLRVGKINKQGTLLSPTSIRGTLYLTLLPTSDLRISFNGDDGSIERLATLSSEAECTSLVIEGISTDKSGRSFVLRIADNVDFYFWCSEKSQLLGVELLRKMKDLLIRKPSLAELTGISDDRLNSFATQIRASIGGSAGINAKSSGLMPPSSCPSSDDSVDSSKVHYPQSSFSCERSRVQQCSGQESTANLNHLGIVYPKSNSFEAELPKSLPSERIAARENMIQVGDDNGVTNSWSLASTAAADPSSSIGYTTGYIVSAGLAIASTIPPLNLDLVDPLVSNSGSVVEKNARDTLRMLINSTTGPPNSQFLEMLPPVLSSSDDMPNALGIGGSRGLYCGTRDVHAGSGGLANMGFMFLSEKPGVGNVCPGRDDSVDKERVQDSNSSGFDTGMM